VSDTFDVVVIGAGAIGLASAYRIARDGRSVAVVEAGPLGRESSWAGGGILSPIHPYAYPEALTDMVARSTRLFPDLARELFDISGVSIELRTTGLLRLALDESDEPEIAQAAAFRSARKLPAAGLDARDRRALGSVIAEEARASLYESEIAQVRNPRLLRALVQATTRLGVHLAPHEPVLELTRRGDRVTGVRTSRRELSSDEVVLAAGAWSGELARRALGLELGVVPVRGQMLLLENVPGTLSTMVLGCGGKYLIPRADGRVLVGSTLENVGFDKRTTLAGIRTLLDAALRLAPGLASAQLAMAWAGLRPATPDRLPYVGRVPGVEGLVLATGHYRNGLVLTPITAEVVSNLVSGRPAGFDLSPFAALRAPARPASD
jgi:glycine oxidase